MVISIKTCKRGYNGGKIIVIERSNNKLLR